MQSPISTIEHKTTISVVSDIKAGRSRNAAGDVVESIPSILLTAEFRGIWNSAADRDSDMQKTVEALMASYKNHVTQSKVP